MPYTAISVQNVSKSFSTGHHGGRSARQTLDRLFRGRLQSPALKGDFWALRDIDFEVASGDVVSIIGRNGAGKSVLLKLLSQVSRPTTGRIEIRGEVAPMLEVGTGFHPDLTGRENIYLNGVILGMKRAEVHRRLDEITEFAGVDAFLDMPVKRYSSGMRMRLAFSVAAHLKRDVFLLDEVLMVGDHEFQERCRGRLRELANDGRTVVIVSHGDDYLEQFCSRALLIDGGRLVASGPPADVYAAYRTLRSAA